MYSFDLVCYYIPQRNDFILLFFFFFQAEDGIRDLVRSRGLGDVYKRQEETKATIRLIPNDGKKEEGKCIVTGKPSAQRVVFARAY